MNEINERIKKLIKTLSLTKSEFARKLEVDRAGLYSQLSGKRKISDKLIATICVRFNVSEKWLRDGAGAMFNVTATASDAETTRRRIVAMYNKLPEELQNELAAICRDILKQAQERKENASKSVHIGDNNRNIEINQ